MSKKDLPSPEYLRQRLRYEPETGRLIWLSHPDLPQKWNTRYAGTEAGNVGARGYRDVRIYGRVLKAHRIIWAILHNQWPSHEIDHIDGNRANNKVNNLRHATRTENNHNIGISRRNKSGVMGVFWEDKRRKWKAYIRVNNVQNNIGRYDTFDDAVAARKEAEIRYGFHANHGRQRIAAR